MRMPFFDGAAVPAALSRLSWVRVGTEGLERFALNAEAMERWAGVGFEPTIRSACWRLTST